LPVRILLVRIHPHTNLTTRAMAALFGTSQSTVDRVIHHLVPALAQALQPYPASGVGPWNRRHPDPGARPIDHRYKQLLLAQRQHPDHHVRSRALRRGSC
jgi:hypothetical protein